MSNLLDPKFWFDLTPVRLSPAFEIGFFVAFTLIILLGLGLRIYKKTRPDKFEKRLLAKITNTTLTLGLVGLAWLFLAFEEIQIFGSKFWLLVGLIVAIVAIIKWVRYWKVTVPQLRLLEQSKAEANKYLPRRHG